MSTPAHRVAVVAFPRISPFHLAVPGKVFANAALALHGGPYDLDVCAETPGVLPTDGTFDAVIRNGLELLARADTIVVPSWDLGTTPSDALLDAIRSAHAGGSRVVGLCLGAFVVAHSGIADGREIATHWHAAERLRRERPETTVRSDVLWVDHGDVVTSAGVVAGIDCCLNVVRGDRGAAAAADVARALVLPPSREGSQSQYIAGPAAKHDASGDLARATAWAAGRLGQPITIGLWAAALSMSRRTFTRRFRDATGTSPGRWLLLRRLDAARALLETSDDGVGAIARSVGFGTDASLRQHFRATYGVTPSSHRANFRERRVAAKPPAQPGPNSQPANW